MPKKVAKKRAATRSAACAHGITADAGAVIASVIKTIEAETGKHICNGNDSVETNGAGNTVSYVNFKFADHCKCEENVLNE